MIPHSFYMQRCIDLAKKAAGYVAPNPMVGAVLVHNDKIIGEGYHQLYGHAHAEVNCITNAEKINEGLLPDSSLYVSLEPCAHFGKTPPCADLIINKKIKKVFVGCRDPFKEVDGKGIEKLLAAGVSVTTGVMEAECIRLNKRFFTFHTRHRPYIILKWAESADKKIAGIDTARLFISNPLSNRLVHKWRSEEAAILVGTNTALLDDPSLTTRLWKGKNPVRLVIDMDLRLPITLRVFDRSVSTVVFNSVKEEKMQHLHFVKISKRESLPFQITAALHRLNIQSLIIEGGSKLLQSFIHAGLWDEARIITNNQLIIGKGIDAPALISGELQEEYQLQSDSIHIYTATSIKSS
jgi:diaminohydroxyphosphoribosylaminopyrimidine deaminase / 5-amino-6-(5-phosphoribosylamino)uracil reductase